MSSDCIKIALLSAVFSKFHWGRETPNPQQQKPSNIFANLPKGFGTLPLYGGGPSLIPGPGAHVVIICPCAEYDLCLLVSLPQ